MSQPKKREDVRILLLQFREDPFIKKQEFDQYVRFTKLRADQIDVLDALTETVTNDCVHGYNGVIVGGVGHIFISDNAPFQEPVLELIRYLLEQNIPTLGICFGAQLAALALGGTVERKPEMFEYGTYQMYLEDEAKNDLMFDGVPSPFNGQMGHKDSITELPEGAVRLTYSDACPNQAFYFPGKKFYVVQYHPELDEKGLKDRLAYYRDHYARDEKQYQELRDRITDSTDASKILERFIDVLVLDEPAQQSVKDQK